MSGIRFVPFNDLLKLTKTPCRLRIGFGKNNNGYPTEIETRFLDLHLLHCVLLMKESGESNRSESRIEMRNKFSADFFSSEVDEHIVHLWQFGS